MTHANAVAAVAAARGVLRAVTAKWRAIPPPAAEIKKNVQTALQPALDYLAERDALPQTHEMEEASAERLVEWIDELLKKVNLFDLLTTQLNAKRP